MALATGSLRRRFATWLAYRWGIESPTTKIEEMPDTELMDYHSTTESGYAIYFHPKLGRFFVTEDHD